MANTSHRDLRTLRANEAEPNTEHGYFQALRAILSWCCEGDEPDGQRLYEIERFAQQALGLNTQPPRPPR